MKKYEEAGIYPTFSLKHSGSDLGVCVCVVVGSAAPMPAAWSSLARENVQKK